MKKIVAVLLAMVLVASMTVAFAVPSKTTQDMDKVTGVAAETEVASDFVAEVGEETPETVAALADITAQVLAGASLSDVFGVEVDSKLDVKEFASLKIDNYKAEYGAVKLTMGTASAFADGQTVSALVLVDGVWVAVEAEVIDGAVVLTVPAEVMEKINGQSVAFAILG